MRKILTYLTLATLAVIGYTSNVCTPCSQNTVAQNCPTSTHLCCMNAAGNGGCCTALVESCNGEGIFYGEYLAPAVDPVEGAKDEPMWIGRNDKYRPPRPEKDIEEVFDRSPRPEEPVEDQPMWIGRKENYRAPRPEEDIEEVFEKTPEEDELDPRGPPHRRRRGNHPPPPPFVRKTRRFIMKHKHELTVAALILAVVFLYRRFFMTPVAPKEEEPKCTCTCGLKPVASVPTGAYALWNPPQQPLVEKQASQLV